MSIGASSAVEHEKSATRGPQRLILCASMEMNRAQRKQQEREQEAERVGPRGQARAALAEGHMYFGIDLVSTVAHTWIGEIEKIGWKFVSASTPHQAWSGAVTSSSSTQYIYFLFSRRG